MSPDSDMRTEVGAPESAVPLPQLFRSVASRWPDLIAIHVADGDWTFRKLDETSDRIAAALQRDAVRVGNRVGLYCPNGAEFAAIYLGILKAGATVVPVNLLLNPKEVAFILDDAGVGILFYHSSLAEAVGAVRKALRGPLRGIAVAGAPAEHQDQRLEDLPDSGAPTEAGLDAVRHTAAILYTSGTTGRPKGAMLSHRNLAANTRSVAAALELRPGEDRLLVVLPMFHAFAATVGMLTPLLHGMGLVPVSRFDTSVVTEAIASAKATHFLGVPSMYSLLLHLDADQIERWASVRFCISGGAAMPLALMRAFEDKFGIPILEGDGPTECGPVTCVNPVRGARKAGSVGLPVPGAEMSIRDETCRPVPDGEMGEVCVRGASVMQGYWGLAEETAESFCDGWFRTGDLGYRDSEGYFFLVDRKKDMIIVNGMNVYPRVIEEVLHRHPDVIEAAVVGYSDALHGEIPVAHVVLRAGSVVTGPDIRSWCKGELGRHEIPRRVIFRQALPKNAAGKIVKRELRRDGERERGVEPLDDH